jgi:solute carrier family 34 (sodium-dependent phosphate cotransporter)
MLTLGLVIGTLLLFFFAFDLLTSSLQQLGAATAHVIMEAASDPFTGLFMGLIITAILQSSSTTTALVIALAASGTLTLQAAVPIIMGANVGTTITSTLVALAFINRKKEFKRAVAAGSYHCFFNLLTVCILFPLEYYYQFLSAISSTVADHFFDVGPGNESPVDSSQAWSVFAPLTNFLVQSINGFVLIGGSFILLFASILLFRKIISELLKAKSPESFSRFVFLNPFKSFSWGILTTAAIRSSTITTSVVVPIVAKKIATLREAAPFIMGANLGTTITAFIAIVNRSADVAVSIAMAHFIFNLAGVLFFFPVPALRRLPVELANALGRLSLRYPLACVIFIILTFFCIPFLLIYFHQI